MKKNLSRLGLATLAVAGLLCLAGPTAAQVAGGTTRVDTTVVESTQIAMGWSVKKTLLGKTIYNEAGQKVGKVEDLIVSPDKSLSYVIVGAGGFVGIGRHDVAIPVTQIQSTGGKLVMPGATKEAIKSMPQFTYASDTTNRDQVLAAAAADIAQGRATLARLEKKSAVATADVKAAIDLQISTLQLDLKSAQTKLDEMQQASVARWKEFEIGVKAATTRLRKSVAAAVG